MKCDKVPAYREINVDIVEMEIKDIIFTRGLTEILDINTILENVDITAVGLSNYFKIAGKFMPSACYYGNIGWYA